MATCKNCKCDIKKCGCADKAIPVAAPCGQGTVYCPNPEPCAETFSTDCIVYTGDSIIDFDIQKGDRVSAIIQKLVLAITSPGCIDGTGCQAPIALQTTEIGTTYMKISWLPVDNAFNYTVYWKTPAAGGWTSSVPPVTPSANPEYTILGLTSGQEYYIKVMVQCVAVAPNPPGYCTSVTISATTI